MNWFRRRAPAFEPNLHLPVLDERDGVFAALRDRRVLIYWPHGFGDFIHLGHLLPLLEPSNTYFLTRFGDDFLRLYDDNEIVTPLYSGVRRIGNGSARGVAHFGLDFKKIRNAEEGIAVPEPLHTAIREAGIEVVLYTDYPERGGASGFPHHTKLRAIAPHLVAPERLALFDLSQPLPTALRLRTPAPARIAVETRLREYVATGDRLYLIAPGGHTELAKVWPDDRVVRLAQLLRARDARARTLLIDERRSEQLGRARGLLPTSTDLFGDLDVPFAHLLIALIRASSGFIGSAAGPLHAALSIGERPIVGIWLAHYPGWYDEPSPTAIHLAGPRVYKAKLDRRPASVGVPFHLQPRIIPFRKHVPSAEDALAALESLQ